jgi:hypothetical protein
MKKIRFGPDEEKILSTVYKEQLSNRHRALTDIRGLKRDLGIQRFNKLVESLIGAGYLNDVTSEIHGSITRGNEPLSALRLTPMGEAYIEDWDLT